MPRNALPLPGTIEGMIAKFVTELLASRARAVRGEDRMTQAVSHSSNKLRWAKKKAKSRGRDDGIKV